MTADEAVIRAAAWVWERYPVVPPVGAVCEFSERLLAQVKNQAAVPIPEEEWGKIRGKWFVSFFCSWDTDALGLPETLNLLVDGTSGEIALA